MPETNEPPVTDEEIQTIIDQSEAGLGDLLAAYAPIEAHYFAAASLPGTAVVYASNTTSIA